MKVQEILDRRIERVRLPNWFPDSYVKLIYLADGTYGPWVYLVSPKAQRSLNIEVGSVEIKLEEAFGDRDDLEEYKGVVFFGF